MKKHYSHSTTDNTGTHITECWQCSRQWLQSFVIHLWLEWCCCCCCCCSWWWWWVRTFHCLLLLLTYMHADTHIRVRPIPEFTDTTDTDSLDLHRYRVPIPIPVVTAQWAWRKWLHAAQLLKHKKNVTWSKTGGGVRTRHHRTGLFFHMTTHCNGVAIFVLFLSYNTPISRYLRKCKL